MPTPADTKRPGAYAVSTESKGEPVFFSLTVPAGTEPGSTFTFRAGDRRGLTARCPPTAKVCSDSKGWLSSSFLLDSH